MQDGEFYGAMHTNRGEADWVTFVRDVIGDDRQTVVAQKAGIDQTTISRWLGGRLQPNPVHVIRFARAYHINPIEGLVAAGLITTTEADMPRTTAADLTVVATGRLIGELARRDQDAVAS